MSEPTTPPTLQPHAARIAQTTRHLIAELPDPASIQGQVNVTVPAVPRLKVTLKQMAKGLQWEIEYSHEEPHVALAEVEAVHQALIASYGSQQNTES